MNLLAWTMFSTTTSLAARNPPNHAALWIIGYSIAGLVLLADQTTKYTVHEYTPYGWNLHITDYFNLVHVWNYGAAFSFLANAGGWQKFFFGAVALVVSAWLIFVLRKPLAPVERLAYALLLGGALGNGLDRGLRGYVVDFLDFHWQGWHWPAFNIADMGLMCGAGLLVWASFRTSTALSDMKSP